MAGPHISLGADSVTAAYRTEDGVRPVGSKIAPIPFAAMAQISDTEAWALHLYLKSVAK